MSDSPKKCAHPACSCTVSGDSKFCSQNCEDSKDVTSLGCDCHHAGCSGDKL